MNGKFCESEQILGLSAWAVDIRLWYPVKMWKKTLEEYDKKLAFIMGI